MFELDAALRRWRKTARSYSMSPRELDELEDHLCASYAVNVRHGEAPADAFAAALRSLGGMAEVSVEYRKARPGWLRVLRAGWLAFAAAFFLPVVDGGITLLDWEVGEGLLPGIQAIIVALEESGWPAFSALTNLVMLTTLWRVRELGRLPVALLGLAVTGSFLLNGWWMTEFHPIIDLRPGYYLWLTSFGLASGALLMRLRVLLRRKAGVSVA